MGDRSVLAKNVAEFADLEALREGPVPAGRFSVTINGGCFDCLFFPGQQRRLFVLLHGARDPETHSIPVFQRWSWHRLFPGSVLYVADPTLHLDPSSMRIGWYVGTEREDRAIDLANLVREIGKGLGLETKHILTYGSSGGGFASIMLACHLGEATAVAINPQTNVLEFEARQVEKLLTKGFGGRKSRELNASELARLNAIEAFGRSTRTKCLYVQNVKDETHYKRHFVPFCAATASPTDGGVNSQENVITLLFDDPKGHGGESKHLAPLLIRIATALADEQMDEAGQLASSSARVLAGFDSPLSVERTVGSLWGEVKAAAPEVQSVSDAEAIALIGGAFRVIARKVETTEWGSVRVGWLGHFVVRRSGSRNVVPDTFVFRPAKPLGDN